MSVRTKYIHFSSWAKVLEAVNQKDSSITDEAAAKAFLEEYNNPYYYYIGFIQSTKEIYTHGKFYDCSKYDDSGIKQLIQSLEDNLTAELSNKVDISAYESLVAEVEDNELVTAKALTDLNNKVENFEESWSDSIFELFVTKENYNSNYSVIESRLNTVEGKTSLSQFTDDLIRSRKVINHGTSDTSYAITPDVYHIWGEVTSLSLTYDTPIDGFANEYLLQFTSGSTATTLSLPDTVKWANDNVLSIESGKTYSISIVNNLALFASFTN